MSRAKAGVKRGPRPEEVKRKISIAQLGRTHSEEARRKISAAGIGRKPSIETRRKMADSHRGSKTNFWKGGIDKKAYKHYHNTEYRHWREQVYKRDDFVCRICAKRGGTLHPHHVKSYTHFPALRYEVSNGVTLCKPCHIQHHKNGGGAV